MRFRITGLLAACLLSPLLHAQKDPGVLVSYRDKIVLYSDIGFNSAPFSVHYPFADGIKKLKYRNNYKSILGFGGAYKWFALRFAFDLPATVLPVSKYGNTNYFDLGVDFSIKKTFIDVDYHNYKGYAIKNAYTWNDTLDKLHPHDIRSKTTAASFSVNVWYLHNKEFRMPGLRGKTGDYQGESKTWYLKSTVNLHGVSNEPATLIPTELIDSVNNKTATRGISAFDFGVIPGVGYVNSYKNWQYAALAGFGPVIQTKVYDIPQNSRAYLGLAPRYDIRLYGGYSIERYFVILSAEFDNKSIRYNKFRYRQTFYSIRLTGGIRLEPKEKEKRSKKK